MPGILISQFWLATAEEVLQSTIVIIGIKKSIIRMDRSSREKHVKHVGQAIMRQELRSGRTSQNGQAFWLTAAVLLIHLASLKTAR